MNFCKEIILQLKNKLIKKKSGGQLSSPKPCNKEKPWTRWLKC